MKPVSIFLMATFLFFTCYLFSSELDQPENLHLLEARFPERKFQVDEQSCLDVLLSVIPEYRGLENHMIVLLPLGRPLSESLVVAPLKALWMAHSRLIAKVVTDEAGRKLAEFHGPRANQCCGLLGHAREKLVKMQEEHGVGKCMPCPGKAPACNITQEATQEKRLMQDSYRENGDSLE